MNEYQLVESVLAEKTKLGEVKRQELANAIIGALDEAGMLIRDFRAVDVAGARVPVDYVTVYGLDISVDANGNAVNVSSPYGFILP